MSVLGDELIQLGFCLLRTETRRGCRGLEHYSGRGLLVAISVTLSVTTPAHSILISKSKCYCRLRDNRLRIVAINDNFGVGGPQIYEVPKFM